MRNQIKIILLLFFIHNNNATQEQPIVYIKQYFGLLGNQISEFCAAKILSEELGLPLNCPPIFGFPETYLYGATTYNKYLPYFIRFDKNSFLELIKNKEIILQEHPLTNFIMNDYFFPYTNLMKYKDEIKKWLRFDTPVELQKNPNNIVLHIRIYTETYGKPDFQLLPFSYYEQALASTTYDQVYICTNEPNHPYIENFKKYNPIITSTVSLHEQYYEKHLSFDAINKINFEEFRFITSFNKIIISLGTFSWWAAFLSNANEIFVPEPSYQLANPQDFPKDEPRYKFIKCGKGF